MDKGDLLLWLAVRSNKVCPGGELPPYHPDGVWWVIGLLTQQEVLRFVEHPRRLRVVNSGDSGEND
jgi:hypothetical protein